MEQLYQCSVCKQSKQNQNFNKCKSAKTGLQPKCRDCEREYKKKNKGHIKTRMKKYREVHKAQEKKQKKGYYLNNKQKINKKNKEWQNNNTNKIKIQKQKYYQKNKEKIHSKQKEWRLNNLEGYRKYQREYVKNKRNTSPHHKLEHRLRNRLLIGLKKYGNKKLDKFWNLVGCTKQELKLHIESQFTEKMDWELFNSGEIVIDHIKPCCSFDLSILEEQQKCFHYTNLQPLWNEDNQKKISEDLKQSQRLKIISC